MIEVFADEYRFLSNFFPVLILFEQRTYLSVEAAYQAAKTLDLDERQQFERIGPGTAKRLGRRVTLREDWELVKIDIMRVLLQEKFRRGGQLWEQLQTTKPHELVEGNYWGDIFWGRCAGEGENWLGKLLMEIRDADPSTS